MQRLTPDLIRKNNPGLTTMVIQLILVDEVRMRFTAQCNVNIIDPVSNAPTPATVEIADASGKVKTWPDVDSIIKALAKANPTLITVSANADVTKLVPSYSINMTPVQIQAKQFAAIIAKLPAQEKRVVDTGLHLTALAPFQNSTNITQKAKWQEAKDANTTAIAERDYLLAEKTRLQPAQA